jgi:ketosteroid isomerase-like protein
MSEEDVETGTLEEERKLTLEAYEAWNARDFDAVIALIHPDVEWTFAGGAQFPGTDDVYRGHEGVRRFWREFIDPWESIRIEITDTREAEDTLVAFVNFHGVGTGSGLKLTVPFVHLLSYRGRNWSASGPMPTEMRPSKPPALRVRRVGTGAPATTRCVPRPASRSVRRSRAPSPSAAALRTDP